MLAGHKMSSSENLPLAKYSRSLVYGIGDLEVERGKVRESGQLLSNENLLGRLWTNDS